VSVADAWAAYEAAERAAAVEVVSVICTIGWHGASCDAARAESTTRLRCTCSCHTLATTRQDTPS
jgi:hypothetical protein